MTTITNTLLDYKELRKYGTVLIETGSAAGDGIQRALDAGFEKVISIEADHNWCLYCRKRFQDKENVYVYEGRSTMVLKTLLQNLTSFKNVVFFLDAHPAGEGTAGHDDLMQKGTESEFVQDKIITEEINIIMLRFIKPTIAIDDQRGVDEYSQRYIDRILEQYPDYLFEFYDENLSGNHLYKNKVLVAHRKVE